MENKKFIVIQCTTDDAKKADDIAAALLQNGAAACVQTLPIKSSYRWKGKIESSAEILLLIKTCLQKYSEAEAIIKKMHNYETPEIIALPIISGSGNYLKWLSDETENQ